MHHLSTSTYVPNVIEIEPFCGQTDERTDTRTCVYVRTDGRTNRWTFETGFIRSALSKSRLCQISQLAYVVENES